MKSSQSGPSGYVTVVFTVNDLLFCKKKKKDVEGSTALWEESVKTMRNSMEIHNQVTRRLINETNGYEVKTEGDAFMVAFSEITDAIKFSLLLQKELMVQKWPRKLMKSKVAGKKFNVDDKSECLYSGLVVRAGMNYGKPIKEEDPTTGRSDYFGPVINKAARVECTACGGAVSIPEVIYGKVKKYLKNEDLSMKYFGCRVYVHPIGKRSMKGMKDENIYYLFPRSLQNRKQKPAPPDSIKNRDSLKIRYNRGKDELKKLRSEHEKQLEELEKLKSEPNTTIVVKRELVDDPVENIIKYFGRIITSLTCIPLFSCCKKQTSDEDDKETLIKREKKTCRANVYDKMSEIDEEIECDITRVKKRIKNLDVQVKLGNIKALKWIKKVGKKTRKKGTKLDLHKKILDKLEKRRELHIKVKEKIFGFLKIDEDFVKKLK